MGEFCKAFRKEFCKEFKLKNFGMTHDDPGLFVNLQCTWEHLKRLQDNNTDHKSSCFCHYIYVLWILIWLAIFVYIAVIEGVYSLDIHYILLTKITFVFQGVTVLMDFLVTLYIHIKRHDIRDAMPKRRNSSRVAERAVNEERKDQDKTKKDETETEQANDTENVPEATTSTDQTTSEGSAEKMEWYMSTTWVLYNIVNSASLLVSIGYFILASIFYEDGPAFTNVSINVHILNSVYTLLLLTLSAKPVQILHVYQPMIYGTLYMLFTLIYTLDGNDPVYGTKYNSGPLDWKNKTSMAVLLAFGAIFLAVPIMHLFCFGVYKLRIYVSDIPYTRTGAKPAAFNLANSQQTYIHRGYYMSGH